jgi:hypothetical protein
MTTSPNGPLKIAPQQDFSLFHRKESKNPQTGSVKAGFAQVFVKISRFLALAPVTAARTSGTEGGIVEIDGAGEADMARTDGGV